MSAPDSIDPKQYEELKRQYEHCDSAQHPERDHLFPVFDSKFQSSTRPQITVHRNLEPNRTRAFASQIDAVHFEK